MLIFKGKLLKGGKKNNPLSDSLPDTLFPLSTFTSSMLKARAKHRLLYSQLYPPLPLKKQRPRPQEVLGMKSTEDSVLKASLCKQGFCSIKAAN